MTWDKKSDPIGRKADIAKLSKVAKSSDKDASVRAKRSLHKISEEANDPYIRSARQALLKATSEGKAEDNKAVSEDIMKHQEHRKKGFTTNRLTSFSDISNERWNQIFKKK